MAHCQDAFCVEIVFKAQQMEYVEGAHEIDHEITNARALQTSPVARYQATHRNVHHILLRSVLIQLSTMFS